MKFVMTAASVVKCVHGGTIAVAGEAKLKVQSNAVLITTGVVGKEVSLCAPPSGTACASVSSVLPASLAQKLKIGGQPVLCEPLNGATTAGTLLAPLAGQAKLKSL